MKVMITGGAGYVGTELVKGLSTNSAVKEIIVFDNISRGNYNLFLDYPFDGTSKITFIKGDILDARKLKESMADVSLVYHLAAIVTTPFANLDPHVYEQVNHWGTADVMYAAQLAGVQRFVYLSSTSVYGASDQIVNEATVPAPKTYYGMSKIRGESHLLPFMDEMEVMIIRCGNVFGYSHSMRFDAVINRFVFEANYFNRITIQGDGKQSRAFVHIDTVVDVLSQIVDRKVGSGIYNFVENNYSVLDLVDVLKSILPSLEFSFVDQHLGLRTLQINTESSLFGKLKMPKNQSLEDRLSAFLSHFSFGQSRSTHTK